MRLRKANIGWVRAVKRHPEAPQRQAVEAAGVGQVFVSDARWQVWREMIDQLRRNDVVHVRWLHLLPPERWSREQSRYDWLWDCVHEIEDRGATWIELETGRRSTVPRERDDAIRDALDYIRRHVNAPLRRRARENGRLSKGRPVKWPREFVEAARETWFDLSLQGAALDAALARGGYPPRRQLQKDPPHGLGRRNK